MKLHRDLGVTQKTAWFMFHRLRETWQQETSSKFAGPVEVDETFMGGKEGNKHASKKLRQGRGTVGKTPVVGAKDQRDQSGQDSSGGERQPGDTEKFLVKSCSPWRRALSLHG